MLLSDLLPSAAPEPHAAAAGIVIISDPSFRLVFFNKAGHKISHYVSAPWRPKAPRTLLGRLRALVVSAPVRDTGGRHIDVAPWPERIDEDGIAHFRDNGRPEYAAVSDQRIKPDVLVFCTGYKQTLPFLRHYHPDNSPPSTSPSPAPSSPTSFTTDNISSSSDGMARGIWRRDDPSLAFIGFVRPNLGAIPPLAELQAQLWVLRLLAPQRLVGARPSSSSSSSSSPLSAAPQLLPEDEPHYRLASCEGARVRYGVDHESYAYQLALDMGAAPSLGDAVRIAVSGGGGRRCRCRRRCRWRIPLTWALGANFNTKFRLRGPWAWDGAADVMEGELWDTVARREIFFGESLPPCP